MDTPLSELPPQVNPPAKVAKAPVKRRSMTPQRMLNAVHAIIEGSDLSHEDPISALTDELEVRIVLEAIGR